MARATSAKVSEPRPASRRSSRPAQTCRHAVYGKQQRDEVLVRFAARPARANTPEQISLEATGPVQHRQAAFEPAAVVGKSLEECGFTGDLQQAAHRAVILPFNHADDPLAH